MNEQCGCEGRDLGPLHPDSPSMHPSSGQAATTTKTTRRSFISQWQATTGCAAFSTAFADSFRTSRQTARAGETALRHRPWERSRIGKIEEHIRRETMFAGKLEFTTGELARLVYCNPAFDVDFNLRKKGDPPPKLKSWQYDRIRRAAPTFADRVGRSNTRGNPYLWRVRDEFWHEVRDRKSKRKDDRKYTTEKGTIRGGQEG